MIMMIIIILVTLNISSHIGRGNVNIEADTNTHKVQKYRTQHWENSHKILACNGRGSNDNDGFTVHGDDEHDGRDEGRLLLRYVLEYLEFKARRSLST